MLITSKKFDIIEVDHFKEITINDIGGRKELHTGDELRLTLTLIGEINPVEVNIPIHTPMTLHETLLLSYSYIDPKDITKAKAALLGYDTCSFHKAEGVDIMLCINRMF